MTVSGFVRPVLLLGLASTAFAPAISHAQNARLGSESGLDRLMQQNIVKDRVFGLKKDGKLDKAEEAAYKGFVNALKTDPANRIKLGEDFVAKFPSSHYLPAIYGVSPPPISQPEIPTRCSRWALERCNSIPRTST